MSYPSVHATAMCFVSRFVSRSSCPSCWPGISLPVRAGQARKFGGDSASLFLSVRLLAPVELRSGHPYVSLHTRLLTLSFRQGMEKSEVFFMVLTGILWDRYVSRLRKSERNQAACVYSLARRKHVLSCGPVSGPVS